LKTNDITVCAFPKSGITYLGFLLTAARLKHNGIDLRPTFYNIDWLLIDTHKFNKTFSPLPLWRDGLGELYKTHSLAQQFSAEQGPPHSFNVIYLLRNPVDTLASYFHFRRQLGGARGSMHEWLDGPQGAIEEWKAHVKSWLIDNRNPSQSLYLIEYEALQAVPKQELRSLAHVLGLSLTDESLDYATGMAHIDVMRGNERAFARRNPVYARFNLEFVRPRRPLRAGGSEEGQRVVNELTPELRGHIERLTRETYDAARHCVEHGP